ncbi:Hypothetical predicted protein [Cloeon dipterum]|uniref:Uncharacterized protein n=1 Tax=Cloeon dipterum TaxID=197152 RepID=A0A8S1CEL2_9INSE|nr:Hypothetical predicted protein [Cloeon dipterum]
MRAPVLVALIAALLVTQCSAAGEGLLSRVMASVWDVVFRSFAEASGYKVEALPPPPPKKKQSEEKVAVVHTSSKSFHTTTERVVTMTETFTSSDDDTSAPHPPFNFYHSEEHSSHWPDKEDDHRHAKDDDDDNNDNSGGGGDADKEDAKEKEPEESRRMKIKPLKVTKRIKSQRSGTEEKITFRQIDKQGPKKAAKSEPLVIKLLSPTPTKKPTLHDSWPSVWHGAH